MTIFWLFLAVQKWFSSHWSVFLSALLLHLVGWVSPNCLMMSELEGRGSSAGAKWVLVPRASGHLEDKRRTFLKAISDTRIRKYRIWNLNCIPSNYWSSWLWKSVYVLCISWYDQNNSSTAMPSVCLLICYLNPNMYKICISSPLQFIINKIPILKHHYIYLMKHIILLSG